MCEAYLPATYVAVSPNSWQNRKLLVQILTIHF